MHASAVSLSKFKMLTRRYRVGCSSCGLNNVPLISELRLRLLVGHFVDFLWFTVHGFSRAAAFLACTCGFRGPACSAGRIDPHVQKDFPSVFVFFTNFALSRFVSDHCRTPRCVCFLSLLVFGDDVTSRQALPGKNESDTRTDVFSSLSYS